MLYDCFLFFNELELLDLRLAELNPHVDKFVLVEAEHTHSGLPKPLYFLENKQRYAPYLDKIEHVIVSDFPGACTPWDREITQRDAIVRGLLDCRSDDLIVISDVDEIPNAKIFSQVDRTTGARLKMSNHYYFLNLRMKGYWSAARVVPYGQLQKYSAHQLRILDSAVPHISEGGWHFSYMGGPTAIREKMRAYSHQEYNCDSYLEKGRLDDLLLSGRDIVGRKVEGSLVLLSHLPDEVIRNPAKYKHLMIDRLDQVPADGGSSEHKDRLNAIEVMVRKCLAQNSGPIIDLASAKGDVAIALANSVYPNVVLAVDAWNPVEESTFKSRIVRYTHGNVLPIVKLPAEFISEFKLPIRFCHFGPSFPSEKLRDNLARARHLLLSEAKLCWHDESSKTISSVNLRQTLGDGGKLRQRGTLWEYSA